MEQEAWEVMLRELARRGSVGASRDDLFRTLKGIAYSDLEYILEIMEQRGYISMQWLGSYDFVAMITEQGLELVNT